MTKSKQQKKLNIVQDDETKDEDMKREKKMTNRVEVEKEKLSPVVRHVYSWKRRRKIAECQTRNRLEALVLFLTRAISFTHC